MSERFIKGFYYFGRGWPLNCWTVFNAAEARIDFRQAASDGFNTVILLVPWRAFVTSPTSTDLHPGHLLMLRTLMHEAEAAGLGVLLRLSYAHHVCDEADDSAEDFTRALLSSHSARVAWQDYLRQVMHVARLCGVLVGAFISWEEFWGPLMRQTSERPETRRDFGIAVGFDRWLDERDHNAPTHLVPDADSPEYALYHRFANDCLRRLVVAGVDAVPELGYQIRVDRNALHAADGEIRWLDNDDYLDVGLPRYSYWAPFIGAENRGERLTADQAAFRLEHALREVSGNGRDTMQVVEQFNFIDDTFKYADHHAAIAPDQLHDFLREAAPHLWQWSGGYGIWAWRDYVQNALVNPCFSRGLEGWSVSGGALRQPRYRLLDRLAARFPRRPARPVIRLTPGVELGQRFLAMHRGLHARYRSEELQVLVSLAPGRASPALEATLDGEHWARLRPASDNPRQLQAVLPAHRGLYAKKGAAFSLRCRHGAAPITEVALFSHRYNVGFREPDGRDGPLLEHLLYLNAAIEHQRTG